MSQAAESYLRSVRRRRRHEPAPEVDAEPKPSPGLVSQGAGSERPRPPEPSIDDTIRAAIGARRGAGIWTPLG